MITSRTPRGRSPAATPSVVSLVVAEPPHRLSPRTARSIFPVVEHAQDEPTADLLTQRLQVHEKAAWMLRSFLV